MASTILQVIMVTPNTIRLLTVILNESPLELLTKKGLDYSQVFELISDALQQGYLKYEDDKLAITNTGFKLIAAKPIPSDKNIWITPEETSKTDKIEIDDLFIPNLKTITNLLK